MRQPPNRHNPDDTEKGKAKALPFSFVKKWWEKRKNFRKKAARRAAVRLERGVMEEYVTYLLSPGRVLISNTLAGLGRGLGFGLGVAILGAIVIPLLKRVDFSRIPFLGELVRELARLLEARLRQLPGA
jgi:hypothetical protein